MHAIQEQLGEWRHSTTAPVKNQEKESDTLTLHTYMLYIEQLFIHAVHAEEGRHSYMLYKSSLGSSGIAPQARLRIKKKDLTFHCTSMLNDELK